MKVALYLRVSFIERKKRKSKWKSEEQKKGYTIKNQERVLRKYCEVKEWEIYDVYKDEGISGKNIEGRLDFRRLLKDAKNGKFKAILITKLDRAFRNTKDALITLDDLKEYGVDFISLGESIDTTTPMGRTFFTMISAFAELERLQTADRVISILEYKFSEGIMVGKMPFGYKWDKKKKLPVVDQKQAAMVKEIFDMVLKGADYKAVCKRFKLAIQSFYNIVRNKVYIGIIEFQGEEKLGVHTPIIKESIFYDVQKKF